MSRLLKSAITVALIALVAPSVARAGDRCCPCKDVDADIESLNARVDWAENEWCISIRYEIELEDVHRGDDFDLVLTPTECGRRLCDASGQAISWVVPLDIACHDDEIEMEDRIAVQLPAEQIHDPYRVKICGKLVCRESRKILDDDSTHARVCSLPPRLVERVVEVREIHEVPVVEHVEIHEVHEAPVIVAPPPPVVVVPPSEPPVVIYERHSHSRHHHRHHRRCCDDSFIHIEVDWDD